MLLGSQFRHYHACLDIFKMKPSKESREFSELVGFIAQACALHFGLAVLCILVAILIEHVCFR